MPIKISKTLINKLPENERPDILDFLRKKAGGNCFLCTQPLNEASDTIVADHDQPEDADGATERENLNLVHHSCNTFKRSAPSIDVRPFLRLKAFVKKLGGLVKYDEVLENFGIQPKPSVMSVKASDNVVEFQFPDGRIVRSTIHEESSSTKTWKYAYVEAPRAALFNDGECQPRNINVNHLWSIYSDLQRNPLHEAPGCRIEQVKDNVVKLLMFDGQHKTIASWLMNRDTISVKVYLDLDSHSAIQLVNSVQAKIKKLPLSPFEFAAKMSEEWSHKIEQYEAEVGSENVSEKGFIRWLPSSERARGKQAFKAALVQEILSDENLEFKKYVTQSGQRAPSTPITENVFKTKVIEPLLYISPLEEKGNKYQSLRAREHSHIIKALNLFTQAALEPEGTADPSPQQVERLERMTYQASLQIIARLIRQVFRFILTVDDQREMFEREPTADEWDKIAAAIRRLASHLVWTTPFQHSKKMRAVLDALQKNQDVLKAFKDVQLTVGYLVGADSLEASAVDD